MHCLLQHLFPSVGVHNVRRCQTACSALATLSPLFTHPLPTKPFLYCFQLQYKTCTCKR